MLGYRTSRCLTCHCTFNERTGTPFNYLEHPTDVVLLVVLWRLRYKLSLHDLTEMFLERGFVFTHEAVRDWEARFAPLITKQLRAKRASQAGRSWYVDAHLRQPSMGSGVICIELSIKMGPWLIRRSREKRNMEAAQLQFL